MSDYSLTEESARKIKSLINKDRYQPPRRYHNTRPTDNSGAAGADIFAARMMADWTTRTAADSQIYELNGADVGDYLGEEDIYDPLSIFAALGNGDWSIVARRSDGKLYVIAANCPGTSPLIASPPASQP